MRVSLGSLEGLKGLPLDPALAGTMVQFKLEESKGRTMATNVKKKVFHGKVKLIKDDTYGFVVCEVNLFFRNVLSLTEIFFLRMSRKIYFSTSQMLLKMIETI